MIGQWSLSTLVQVISWCLAATSHYLNHAVLSYHQQESMIHIPVFFIQGNALEILGMVINFSGANRVTWNRAPVLKLAPVITVPVKVNSGKIKNDNNNILSPLSPEEKCWRFDVGKRPRSLFKMGLHNVIDPIHQHTQRVYLSYIVYNPLRTEFCKHINVVFVSSLSISISRRWK